MLSKLNYSIKYLSIMINYHLGRYKNPIIWIVSDGRSGSTWLSSLINSNQEFREIFEPVHCKHALALSKYPLAKYIPVDGDDKVLDSFLLKVFSGNNLYPRADKFTPSYFHRGLLVKDIYANLFLGWACRKFPDIKKVMLIRHPFEVAFSKCKLRNWTWVTDPSELMLQPRLYDDYLKEFKSIILYAKTEFEKYVVYWAIIHYVSFKQLNSGDVSLVFYEDLRLDPECEIMRLYSDLGIRFVKGNSFNVIVNSPSRVSENSALDKSGGEWKNVFSEREIEFSEHVLTSFGLNNLYDEFGRPNREVAENMIG